jgi:hypothetical protein
MANKPRKRAAATVGQAIPWSPPLTTAPLSQRVGSSILDDFVAGHSAADVFREIVQNEFDGGGSAIEILFGETELVSRDGPV